MNSLGVKFDVNNVVTDAIPHEYVVDMPVPGDWTQVDNVPDVIMLDLAHLLMTGMLSFVVGPPTSLATDAAKLRAEKLRSLQDSAAILQMQGDMFRSLGMTARLDEATAELVNVLARIVELG